MLKLFIKGSEDETRKALKARDFVNYVYVGETKYKDQVWTFSNAEQLDKAIRWFSEPAPLDAEHGYPVGTLLFFSTRKNVETDGYN